MRTTKPRVALFTAGMLCLLLSLGCGDDEEDESDVFDSQSEAVDVEQPADDDDQSDPERCRNDSTWASNTECLFAENPLEGPESLY